MTALNPAAGPAEQPVRTQSDEAATLIRQATTNGAVDTQALASVVATVRGADPARAAALAGEITARLSPVESAAFNRSYAAVPSASAPAAPSGGQPGVSRSDLALDVTQVALDVVGIFEPTPFADLANTGISAGRGDWLGAGLSIAGVIPYIGDAAKLGKIGKWAKTVTNAIELAKTDAAFAKMVRPALEQLSNALKAIPQSALDALPHSAQQQLSRMSRQLDEALGTTRAPQSFTPSRTAPTGEVGGVPGGTRTTNDVNASVDNKRGIMRENQSADILADRGYRVEQNPTLSDADRIQHGIKPEKNPDYLIEGRVFDNLAPLSPNAAGVYSGIASKVGQAQAHRIVVNLGDTPNVRPGDVQQMLRDYPIPGLQEVIIIDKSGAVHKTFPQG